MKKFTFILIVSLFSLSTLAQNDIPQGAWKLIQTEEITDGTTEITFPATNFSGMQYKIWSENNWMFFVEWNQEETSGEGYGGGTYTIDGNEYNETIVFHSNPPYEGRTINMTLELIDNTLNQSYHPVDSLGQVIENTLVVEKYVRWE